MMKLPQRRQFLHLAAGAAALSALPRIARAQAYPTRPVRIIVGFATGGPLDITTRLIGQWLSERLGQQFIIENRPGAGSNLATEAVVRSHPDGYTLLAASASNAWNTTLYDNLSFNFIHDIVPVATVTRQGGVMLVNPSIPANSIPEFISYAKANPHKINMGSGGPGSAAHLYGELFNTTASVDLVHVPYRGGGPALMALLGNQVQVFFGAVSVSIEHIKSGKVRPLGVTTAGRMDLLPNVPPIGDFVPHYEATAWDGIGAPKDTPKEIVARLNAEINAAFANQGFKARLADLGVESFPGSPGEFGKFLIEYTEKWAKVIRAANIKTE
jgi:tripartite-type tricarboxylate transporter receptor subunit TctC